MVEVKHIWKQQLLYKHIDTWLISKVKVRCQQIRISKGKEICILQSILPKDLEKDHCCHIELRNHWEEDISKMHLTSSLPATPSSWISCHSYSTHRLGGLRWANSPSCPSNSPTCPSSPPTCPSSPTSLQCLWWTAEVERLCLPGEHFALEYLSCVFEEAFVLPKRTERLICYISNIK